MPEKDTGSMNPQTDPQPLGVRRDATQPAGKRLRFPQTETQSSAKRPDAEQTLAGRQPGFIPSSEARRVQAGDQDSFA